jgi:tetratricopeptide (TPR) repeat protein
MVERGRIQGRWGHRFRHGLVQQVVYENMRVVRRRAYHRRVGDWLAERYGEEAREYETLAYHYDRGQGWGKAFHYHRLAGAQSAQAYANRDAMRHLARALELAAHAPGPEVLEEVHASLGQVHLHVGDYEQAARAHQRELELLSSRAADALALAEVHFALGRVYHWWSKYDRALEWFDRGLGLAGEEDSTTRARLLTVRCASLINVGKLGEAERDGLGAVQIARAVGARTEEAYACNSLGALYGTKGQFELALRYHQHSLALRRELGIVYDVAWSLTNVATALSCLGRLDEAEGRYREALGIHRRIGDRMGEGMACHNLAWLRLDQERPGDAEVEFRRALDIWERIDHAKGVAFVHNDLGTLYQGQGRLDEAFDHLERSARIYEEIGAYTFLSDNYVALAQVLVALGRVPYALRAAEMALRRAGDIEDRRRQAVASRTVGEVHLARGDLEDAERYARMSLDLAQQDPALPDQAQAATGLLEKIRQA